MSPSEEDLDSSVGDGEEAQRKEGGEEEIRRTSGEGSAGRYRGGGP